MGRHSPRNAVRYTIIITATVLSFGMPVWYFLISQYMVSTDTPLPMGTYVLASGLAFVSVGAAVIAVPSHRGLRISVSVAALLAFAACAAGALGSSYSIGGGLLLLCGFALNVAVAVLLIIALINSQDRRAGRAPKSAWHVKTP